MTKTISLAECPVGLFRAASGELCFKSEYTTGGKRIDAYVVRTGEYFWGGTKFAEAQRALQVTPLSGVDLFPEAVAPEPVTDFLLAVADEIERAAMLHPGPNPNLAALTEEVGEVAKALFEARVSALAVGEIAPFQWDAIREEAVQVAAMAFRIVFEGDPTMGVVPDDYSCPGHTASAADPRVCKHCGTHIDELRP